jgi:hypothetical protein
VLLVRRENNASWTFPTEQICQRNQTSIDAQGREMKTFIDWFFDVIDALEQWV